jgi:hypothetical protein
MIARAIRRPVMDFPAFKSSLGEASPPKGLSPALQALWWEAKGDWDKAHECAQANDGKAGGDRVHAYLHRKEGDRDNAGYWYSRVGEPFPRQSLEAEWEAVAKALLKVA